MALHAKDDQLKLIKLTNRVEEVQEMNENLESDMKRDFEETRKDIKTNTDQLKE